MSDLKEIKIIVLGSSKVGKTSLLKRYFKNEFDESFYQQLELNLLLNILNLMMKRSG